MKNWKKAGLSLVVFLLGSMPLLLRAQDIVLPEGAGLPSGEGGIAPILEGVVNWLLVIFISLAVIAFVISGIWYLTAAGNEERMEKGKKGVIWSIIGVVVGLMGFVILQTVDTLLNARTEGTYGPGF